MRLVGTVLLVLLCPLLARAQHCGVAVQSYGHHVQNYGHVQYQQHHYNAVTLVPVVAKAIVSPDYYFGVQDSYRDKVLADAVAGKVFSLLLAQQAAANQQPQQPQPRTPQEFQQQFERQAARAVAEEELPQGLAAVIETSCVSCHAGPKAKGSFDLSDPRSLSRAQRGLAYVAVESGEMPQKGGPLPPGAVALFEQYWKAGK